MSILDDKVLVFTKDYDLLFITLGSDLDSISFNYSEAISSQKFDLSINISIDFNGDSDDVLVTLGSESKGNLLDVEVDFLGDLSDLNISPGPEVGGFSINVGQNSNLY